MKVIYMEDTIKLLSVKDPDHIKEMVKKNPIPKETETVKYFLIVEKD
jgi:hypothetical protein